MSKVKLGEICTLKSGTTLKEDLLNTSDGIPYVKVSDMNIIGNEKYIIKTNSYADKTNVAKMIFPKGTILFPKRGGAIGTNKKRIASREVCADLNTMGVIPSNKIRSLYLYYYFQNIDFGSLCNGSSVPQINNSDIAPLEINLLSLDEQDKIAYNLDKVTHTIDLCNAILEKLDMLVKSRFVEMFGDININSKKWNIQPLGELCTIVRGGSPRPIEKFLGGEVPWIKIGDATDGDNIYLSSTKEHIIQEGVKKSRLVKAGSLIFANCGVSLGFARIITFDGCIHDGWLALEDIDERLDKVFLLQALNQMTDHFRSIAPAGTQPNLNTAIMKAYLQIIPPIELQKQYIAFVEQTDKSKLAVKQVLEKAETLKKALMQEYFG